MKAIDTNILVRLLTKDDPQQVEIAQGFVERGAWVSHVVLAETAWVLSAVYKLQSAAIATAIEMLLDHRHIAIQERSTVAAALEHFRSQPTLGFSDCLILEIARKAGYLPLGTFDRKLGSLADAQKL